MAFDEKLADRMRKTLGKRAGLTEKKMFGGIGFLLNGNMCCGVYKDDMIARVGADDSGAVSEPYARAFDITGKPMKGWVMVAPKGVATDGALKAWVDRSVKFARTLPAK